MALHPLGRMLAALWQALYLQPLGVLLPLALSLVALRQWRKSATATPFK